MTSIVYSVLNKKSLVARLTDGRDGRTHPFHQTILALKGRWRTNLVDSPGWVVPRAQEVALKNAIATWETSVVPVSDPVVVAKVVSETDILGGMQQNVKSRREQHKYHRAVSPDEREDEVSNTFARDSPKVEKYCKQFVQPSTIHSDDDTTDTSSSSEEEENEKEETLPPKKQFQQRIAEMERELEMLRLQEKKREKEERLREQYLREEKRREKERRLQEKEEKRKHKEKQNHTSSTIDEISGISEQIYRLQRKLQKLNNIKYT